MDKDMKIKLPIIDNMFSHCHTTSDKPSEIMEWDRNELNKYDYVFITDTMLKQVDNIKNKKKYAWLVESPEITSNYYIWLANNSYKFDKIFTFKKDFLENIINTKFLPIGGCWINSHEQLPNIENKNKLISLVSSDKSQTSGHKLRHEIINNFREKFDLYGRKYNPIDNKITSLKHYMFQIVVENTKEDYYFTEKLIDCLRTGTIPIYWGCPSINKFFDTESILKFNNLEDLKKILDYVTPEFYFSKKENILKNFNLSEQFICAENYLVKNYKNEF